MVFNCVQLKHMWTFENMLKTYDRHRVLENNIFDSWFQTRASWCPYISMIVCLLLILNVLVGICTKSSLSTLFPAHTRRSVPWPMGAVSSSATVTSSLYMAAQKKTNYFCYLIRLNVNESAFGHGLCLWATRARPRPFLAPAMHSTHRFFFFISFPYVLYKNEKATTSKQRKKKKYAR